MKKTQKREIILNENSLGIFDSGIGGLTVVKEIKKKLPKESIIYFADTARVPYGDKSLKDIKKFALQICNFLREKNVKMIVMGCNISSSVALCEAQKKLSIPVIGLIEGAVEKALKQTHKNRIGIIATSGTIKSKAYLKEIKKNRKIKFVSKSCPLLVPIVEEGKINNEETRKILKKYLKPLLSSKIDTLILGCTHYPYLQKEIRKIIGKEIEIVDPSKEIVKKVKKILKEKNMQNIAKNKKDIFYVTGSKDSLLKFGTKFLGKKITNIHKVKLT